MKIEIKDILTLDDNNEYIVVSKTLHNGGEYFFLTDLNQNNEFKILKLNYESEKLFIVTDERLVEKLMPLFFEETTKIIDVDKLAEEIK